MIIFEDQHTWNQHRDVKIHAKTKVFVVYVMVREVMEGRECEKKDHTVPYGLWWRAAKITQSDLWKLGIYIFAL